MNRFLLCGYGSAGWIMAQSAQPTLGAALAAAQDAWDGKAQLALAKLAVFELSGRDALPQFHLIATWPEGRAK